MSIPSFKSHPAILQFLGLKRYFRSHETHESRKRVNDFRTFSRLMNYEGDEIAFDILGSVNFGQATTHSDTDIIMYTHCEQHKMGECGMEDCFKISLFKHMFMNLIAFETDGPSYKVEVVDCINLNQLEKDLEDANADSPVLVRFGFYRSICRGINRKLLRKYERKLNQNPVLRQSVQEALGECFNGIAKTSRHLDSFRKYIERLNAEGILIPSSVADKIRTYLY